MMSSRQNGCLVVGPYDVLQAQRLFGRWRDLTISCIHNLHHCWIAATMFCAAAPLLCQPVRQQRGILRQTDEETVGLWMTIVRLYEVRLEWKPGMVLGCDRPDSLANQTGTAHVDVSWDVTPVVDQTGGYLATSHPFPTPISSIYTEHCDGSCWASGFGPMDVAFCRRGDRRPRDGGDGADRL